MGEHLSNVVKVLDGSLGFGKKREGTKRERDGRNNSVWQKMTQVHYSYLMDKKF